MRRVKCDESKPRCQKCVSYGLECSLESGLGVSDMQLEFAGSFRVDLGPSGRAPFHLPLPRVLPDLPTYLPLAGAQGLEMYQISPFDRDLLKKFRENAMLTSGPKENAMVFQAQTLEFAIQHPFLTHLILTLALLYDVHMIGQPDNRRTASLAFHFYHGVSLFNAKLYGPVEASEKDTLWSAAALVGASSFADVKASTSAESWPMSSHSATDLDWMKMIGGKKAVYETTKPTRPGSVFNDSCGQFTQPTSHVGTEIHNLPPKFIEMYNLDQFSTPENNPYHGAATVLAQIMPIKCNRKTISKFLSFIAFPDARYSHLLEQKDPPALLLLAYWYAKTIAPDQWWIWRRATLEGPAIVAFLEKAFKDNPEVLGLLDFPKQVFDETLGQRRPAGFDASGQQQVRAL